MNNLKSKKKINQVDGIMQQTKNMSDFCKLLQQFVKSGLHILCMSEKKFSKCVKLDENATKHNNWPNYHNTLHESSRYHTKAITF